MHARVPEDRGPTDAATCEFSSSLSARYYKQLKTRSTHVFVSARGSRHPRMRSLKQWIQRRKWGKRAGCFLPHKNAQWQAARAWSASASSLSLFRCGLKFLCLLWNPIAYGKRTIIDPKSLHEALKQRFTLCAHPRKIRKRTVFCRSRGEKAEPFLLDTLFLILLWRGQNVHESACRQSFKQEEQCRCIRVSKAYAPFMRSQPTAIQGCARQQSAKPWTRAKNDSKTRRSKRWAVEKNSRLDWATIIVWPTPCGNKARLL